jgi:hypothetical protein
MPGLRFSAEQRAKAVRLVAEAAAQHESQWAATWVGRRQDRRVSGDGAQVGAPGGGRRGCTAGDDQRRARRG